MRPVLCRKGCCIGNRYFFACIFFSFLRILSFVWKLFFMGSIFFHILYIVLQYGSWMPGVWRGAAWEEWFPGQNIQEVETMPALKCSAVTCIYNKQELCSKGDIQVTGDNAVTADQTSCGSFQERKGESMTASCTSGCGCETIAVDCQACKCIYNDNCKCNASQIGIAGSGATTSQQTMCSTFSCK